MSMSSQHKPMFTKEDLSKIYKAAALYDSHLCNDDTFVNLTADKIIGIFL